MMIAYLFSSQPEKLIPTSVV